MTGTPWYVHVLGPDDIEGPFATMEFALRHASVINGWIDRRTDPITDATPMLWAVPTRSPHGTVDYERPVPTVCGSEGPRIGGEGRPICGQPAGHDGTHRGGSDTGFKNVTWSDMRPVPTADEPRSSLDVWNAMDTSGIGSLREAFLAGAALSLPAPQPPTREQIAEALYRREYPEEVDPTTWSELNDQWRNDYLHLADAVLALLQKGGNRG